ncbi:Predicted P-loop ATPase and inactivated derivatives [Paenibacillus tianmuensis]|uniref:Predicted P-loop ATPase and inactivated derivatives n=1 Tax=Paenibacillus tianmuensis TaxID=624147 RepID=A0A1G4TXQ2_9BACL|nr:virulence-associated E family protein [Paenibacillus tianmuensis]SCW86186.1 Predicted P-loop ATPase and inactivated derivatives [Paenibacillus tianmuensis]
MQELDISFGKHRADTNWKPEYLTWGEFVDRLRKVRRTAETMAQYDAMHNIGRGKVKDGAAFVGGLVRGGRRKKENVDTRSLITLDVDRADDGFLFAAELVLGGCAYVVYSTHSHRPQKPKYRLIVPADRAMTPDEYAAVSRQLAEQIGMGYFDKTTFEVHRLMYLPSCSKDAEPVLEIYEGDPLSVDGLLAEYDDWRDVMQWPRHPDAKAGPQLGGKKAQDPREKHGTIGLFCRAFTIEEGIDTFLSDIYVPGSMPNRYTYTAGTSGNGLEVYPDQDLAYSHQDSDPIADGRTYNLFDLVRVHKFGHLDERVKEHTPDAKKPSHVAMEHFVVGLPEVKRLKMSEIQETFGDMDHSAEPDDEEPENDSWEEQLELHHKTNYPLPTAQNIELLLTHGPFQWVLAYDEFGNSEVIRKSLPWRERERPTREYEPWLGADDDRRDHWFDKVHKIKSASSIKKAFTEVTRKNKFHPIKTFIESTAWDGIQRAERIFIVYLGAADTHYTRQVTRKMLLTAVARLYRPGCKFDQMLVLVGPQGAGKSSLLAKLGRDWFSDSLRTFENKEAGEHLQAGWIFEIGELSAMKKSEVEEVKAFLSKTEDRYRVAYDRQVSEFPRKCVFFGTTNTRDFLRDATGNRRFWPVEVVPERAELSHWKHLTDDVVRQIWVEVLTWFKTGESLELDHEARLEAERQQAAHMEADPREGLIQEWLETPVQDEFGDEEYIRKRVCAAMIWIECLGNKKGAMRPWEAKEICDILRRVPGWAERNGRARVPEYGLQTVFERLR